MEWKAIKLVNKELRDRNVDLKKIETAKYLGRKKMKLSLLKKANKGYHLLDFIFDPLPNIIEIMFSWELKKDGYNKKAQQ